MSRADIFDKDAARTHSVADGTVRVAASLLLASAELEEGDGGSDPMVQGVGEGSDVRSLIEAAVAVVGGGEEGETGSAGEDEGEAGLEEALLQVTSRVKLSKKNRENAY